MFFFTPCNPVFLVKILVVFFSLKIFFVVLSNIILSKNEQTSFLLFCSIYQACFFCLQVDIDEEKLLGRQLERGAPVQAIQVEWGVSTFINCFYRNQVRSLSCLESLSTSLFVKFCSKCWIGQRC